MPSTSFRNHKKEQNFSWSQEKDSLLRRYPISHWCTIQRRCFQCKIPLCCKYWVSKSKATRFCSPPSDESHLTCRLNKNLQELNLITVRVRGNFLSQWNKLQFSSMDVRVGKKWISSEFMNMGEIYIKCIIADEQVCALKVLSISVGKGQDSVQLCKLITRKAYCGSRSTASMHQIL